MKKSLVLTLALVFVLGIASTAFAAANPFSDVPANSWAYKAVAQLTKDGVIDGYPDGTYKGENNMTRYEMAQIVYKAVARADKANAEDRALIDKLSAEFANEINNLGVKVAKLDDQVNKRIYLTGQVTLRYDNYNVGLNYNAGGVNVPSEQLGTNNGDKMFRTELYVNGTINDGWKYFASLRNDKYFGYGANPQNSAINSNSQTSGNNYTQFRQAYVQGKIFGVQTTVGRMPNAPAYGFVVSEDMTGLGLAGGGDVIQWQGFYGNTDKMVNQTALQVQNPTTLNWSQTNVNWWDLAVAAKISKQLNFKAAWMGANLDQAGWGGQSSQWQNAFYNGNGAYIGNMNFVEAGADWTFAKDWKLTGLYSMSSAAAQNTGYRFQLDYKAVDINTPGSWHAWAAYSNVQANASWDSLYNDYPGFNNNVGSSLPNIFGAQGWEVGFDYVWAKNIQMEMFYNNYNPTMSSDPNWVDANGQSTPINGVNGSVNHFRTDFYFYF